MSKDITGLISGRLTALQEDGRDKHNAVMWLCKCECGNIARARKSNLMSGQRKSCGCLNKGPANNAYKHGMYKTPTYKCWASMKARCKHDDNYKDVKICPEFENFEGFYKYMGDIPENMNSVDRIDNSLGYEIGNVRWGDNFIQNRNKGNCINITIKGKTQLLHDWIKEIGCTRTCYYYRTLKKGMSPKEALLDILSNPKLNKNNV